MWSAAHRMALGAGLFTLSWSGVGSAQVDARALLGAVSAPRQVAGGRAQLRADLPAAFSAPGSRRACVLAELPSGADARSLGLRPVAPGFGALEVSPAELQLLPEELKLSWAPARQVLLDRAAQWTRAQVVRNLPQGGGQGAIVGIVDTGVDIAHPDLRHPDGRTRVAWLLDLTRDPQGLHPELERDFGCTTGPDFKCAVYSDVDLDLLLANGSSLGVPRDTTGHGTHVASLAAGNGLANGGQYAGIAPEAALIVVRATRGPGYAIQDADALLATRFIFERASEMGCPAVVNLSLGTDFGAHDGGSTLERALAAFVGPDWPGRAIVTAVGNSATLYEGLTARYPEPVGVHTEVHVPRTSTVRVPLLTPPTGQAVTRASLYVWIAARPGDALAVGVDNADGRWIQPVHPGQAEAHRAGELEATVLNGVGEEGNAVVRPGNAVVVIDGAWPSGQSFGIRLHGYGTASLWVQSEGDLSPSANPLGALFPRGMQQGTVNIPATHPELIAVGATLNRTHWTDRDSNQVSVEQFGDLEDPQPDSPGYFSAAGPTAAGFLKPDLVAPGAYVVGAMSSLADPAINERHSIFAGGSVCSQSSDCRVVDSTHAVLSGTSMAAPIVAGAVALLLSREPDLTQGRVRSLLQAGTRRLQGSGGVEQQLGAGALDLERALEAQRLTQTSTAEAARGATPSAATSWIALANDFARPDSRWKLRGMLQLRTAGGAIAHGFDRARLELDVQAGSIVDNLQQQAPGSWTFALAAPSGSGGGRLRVRVLFDRRLLLARDVPVAVDRWVREEGVWARGGCAVAVLPQPARSSSSMLAWALAALVRLARRSRTQPRGGPDRRCRSEARMERHPDRTGATGRLLPG